MQKTMESLIPRLSGDVWAENRVCRTTCSEVADKAMTVKRVPREEVHLEKRIGLRSEY